MIHTVHQCDVCGLERRTERKINVELPWHWGYHYLGKKAYLMCDVCSRHLDEIDPRARREAALAQRMIKRLGDPGCQLTPDDE